MLNTSGRPGNVKGVNNGKLMCETRLESRQNRPTTTPRDSNAPPRRGNDTHPPNDSNSHPPHNRIRSRGAGPRDGDEWMLVRRRAPRNHPQQEVLRQRQPRAAPPNSNSYTTPNRYAPSSE